MRRETTFLTGVGLLLGSIGVGAWRAYQLQQVLEALRYQYVQHGKSNLLLPVWASIVCSGLLVLFAVPLGLKLYLAWMGIHISEEEKAPGAAGIRAWLSPANVIFAGLTAGCAAWGYGCQFFGVLLLLIGALLIQPLIGSMKAAQPLSQPQPSPTLAPEREKVLSMLEAGKITAEESAELLNALGATQSAASADKPAPISSQQRLALLGAGLVLVGFFLPWFSINLGKEVEQVMQGLQGALSNFPGIHLPQNIPGLGGFPAGSGNAPVRLSTPTIQIRGGDVDHGLGWLVLVLGLGTAVLPIAAKQLEPSLRRTISLVALGACAIILLYLIVDNFRIINAGAPIALVGIVIELLSLVVKPAVAANPPLFGPEKAGAA